MLNDSFVSENANIAVTDLATEVPTSMQARARDERRQPIQPRKNSLFVLGVILATATLLRLAVFTGYHGEDDLFYVALGCELAEGRADPTDGRHWQARSAMVVPLAVLFRVFGPSITALAALPLLWSLSCIGLAYLIGRLVYQDEKVALLGAFFVAIFPMDVTMATIYLPAMGIAAFAAASFLAFYTGLRRGHWSLFLLAGILLGIAYLHRITAGFMILPLVLWIMFERKWRNGYLWALTGFALVFLMELAWFSALFDDPLYRIHNIVGVGKPVHAGGDAVTAHVQHHGMHGKLVKRLVKPLRSLLFNQEYGFFYYFIIPATVCLAARGDRRSMGLILWFSAVGGYTLWGTVSRSAWAPLFPIPRYMTIVTIPGVLLLARWLYGWSQPHWRWACVALLIVTSLACIYVDKHRTYPTIGRGLITFWRQHPETPMVAAGQSYGAMFVANGMKPPQGVSFLGRGTLGWTRKLNPQLNVYLQPSQLENCFVTIAFNERMSVPKSWQVVTRVSRTRRWYAIQIEKAGGMFKRLAWRLSPRQGYTIYFVPKKQDKNASS